MATHSEYKIIIPKWDNSGRKIKAEEVQKIAVEVSDKFGGCTIRPTVLGCWVDDQDELQCEENLELVTASDNGGPEDDKWVADLAQRLGNKFGQASVFVSEDRLRVDFPEGQYKPRLHKKLIGHDWFKQLI